MVVPVEVVDFYLRHIRLPSKLELFETGALSREFLLYLDFTSDDNDKDSDIRDGIAAALNALQAYGENDPLTSIFVKVSATSRADASSDGIVGEEQPIGFHFLVPDTTGLETWATNVNYGVPEAVDWAVCYDIQLNNGIPHDAADFKDFSPLLDQMKDLGLIKHYHVVGDGIKPFFAATGSWNKTVQTCTPSGGGDVTCSTSKTLSDHATVNGFFFAYDTADEEVLQLLDTDDYACSFEAVDRYSVSPWLNRDSPGGSGDYESATYHYNDGSIPCSDPLGTEVRRVSDGLDAHEIGDQRFAAFNHGWGFTCVNNVSGYDNCDDYEVRYYCANDTDRQIQITRHDKCLDLSGGNTSNGGNIQQWSCQNGNTNQVFEMQQVGDDWMILHQASGKCVTAFESDLSLAVIHEPISSTNIADNGAPVVLWDCQPGNEQQLFTLTDNNNTAEADDFTIESKAFGKCLDLSGGSSSNGTDIQLWSCSSSNLSQNFKLL